MPRSGSFVILSIARANTNELSSMLRDAFTTKFLFRPTREEAQFLWSVSQYELLALLSFKPEMPGLLQVMVCMIPMLITSSFELKFDSF